MAARPALVLAGQFDGSVVAIAADRVRVTHYRAAVVVDGESARQRGPSQPVGDVKQPTSRRAEARAGRAPRAAGGRPRAPPPHGPHETNSERAAPTIRRQAPTRPELSSAGRRDRSQKVVEAAWCGITGLGSMEGMASGGTRQPAATPWSTSRPRPEPGPQEPEQPCRFRWLLSRTGVRPCNGAQSPNWCSMIGGDRRCESVSRPPRTAGGSRQGTEPLSRLAVSPRSPNRFLLKGSDPRVAVQPGTGCDVCGSVSPTEGPSMFRASKRVANTMPRSSRSGPTPFGQKELACPTLAFFLRGCMRS